MKKYKLLKDLPGVKAGAIAEFYNGVYYNNPKVKPGGTIPEIGYYWESEFFKEELKVPFQCDLFPDFFEPVTN